jgi:hypothetical protein
MLQDNYVTQVMNWCAWLHTQQVAAVQEAVCIGMAGGPYGPVGCMPPTTPSTCKTSECLLIGSTTCVQQNDPCAIPEDDCIEFGVAHFSQLRQLFDGGSSPVDACGQINSCPKLNKPEQKQVLSVLSLHKSGFRKW